MSLLFIIFSIRLHRVQVNEMGLKDFTTGGEVSSFLKGRLHGAGKTCVVQILLYSSNSLSRKRVERFLIKIKGMLSGPAAVFLHLVNAYMSSSFVNGKSIFCAIGSNLGCGVGSSKGVDWLVAFCSK